MFPTADTTTTLHVVWNIQSLIHPGPTSFDLTGIPNCRLPRKVREHAYKQMRAVAEAAGDPFEPEDFEYIPFTRYATRDGHLTRTIFVIVRMVG